MAYRDQRAYNSLYYRRHREAEIERVRLRQNATRDRLRDLRTRACQDCGRDYLPHQMDFDHRDPAGKSFRITSGRASLASAERLDSEVAKCDVVCANCHRIRTVRRSRARSRAVASQPSTDLVRKRVYWRFQSRLLDSLKDIPCRDCGRRYPVCAMDFDHREERQKRCTVSRMVGRAGTARIMAEVAKCDIVCANCHRDRTYRRRQAGSSGRE